MNYLKRFVHEDEGQDMVEYGLLAAFISIAAITALSAIGPKLAVIWNKITAELAKA